MMSLRVSAAIIQSDPRVFQFLELLPLGERERKVNKTWLVRSFVRSFVCSLVESTALLTYQSTVPNLKVELVMALHPISRTGRKYSVIIPALRTF